jgi:hypothetical protein
MNVSTVSAMMNVPGAEKNQEHFGNAVGASCNEVTVLHSDYEYIDSLLERIEALLQQGFYAPARRQFEELREALERHLLLEEQTAFSVHERLAQSDSLTTTLRSEHDCLRHLMVRTSRALRAGEGMCWDALSNLSDIHEILGPHSEKVEALLFSRLRGATEPSADAPKS